MKSKFGKKCFVIYGLQDRRNPNKYRTEKGERELVKSHTIDSRKHTKLKTGGRRNA